MKEKLTITVEFAKFHRAPQPLSLLLRFTEELQLQYKGRILNIKNDINKHKSTRHGI